MNDYSCIIAQSLKNVNLPLESTCTPRFIGNDPIIKISTIKSKESQLKIFIEKLCKKYPELREIYHQKYDKKLNNHKFLSYFKDIDSIYQTEDKLFDEYIKYIMSIQDELMSDVIKSGQTKMYYFLFYLALIFFILGFLYYLGKTILITRNKFFKELNKNGINDIENVREKEINVNEKIFLKKLVRYIIILIPILISEPIICLIYSKTINISNYIIFSIFFKYISLLIIIIIISFINNLQRKINYIKIIFILTFIIVLHLIMYYIKLFSFIDKNVNTQSKSDFFKIYLSYPLLLIYAVFEFYSIRNYYIIKKYNIRYIYIVIPYLIFSTYYMLKFDLYLKQHNSYHKPETIQLMRKIYLMIFLLLLFIKPLIQKKNELIKVIPNVIFNTKLFLLVMINFICIETERVTMVLLFFFILFCLCNSFKKEKDIFLKIIYLVIISCYPQIFFIGNQGTYSLDSSIKITVKCPSKWADDLPVVMGIIFSTHKFKYYIISSAYVFSLYKRTKTKSMNFYTEFARLMYIIQFFAMVICYLYFLKNEIEHSYIQMLFLIATKAIPLFLYDVNYLINYALFRILNLVCKSKIEYEKIEQIEGIS